MLQVALHNSPFPPLSLRGDAEGGGVTSGLHEQKIDRVADAPHYFSRGHLFHLAHRRGQDKEAL